MIHIGNDSGMIYFVHAKCKMNLLWGCKRKSFYEDETTAKNGRKQQKIRAATFHDIDIFHDIFSSWIVFLRSLFVHFVFFCSSNLLKT